MAQISHIDYLRFSIGPSGTDDVPTAMEAIDPVGESTAGIPGADDVARPHDGGGCAVD